MAPVLPVDPILRGARARRDRCARLALKLRVADAVGSILDNRGLLWQLARRDFVGRYRGSRLGLLWAIVNPLLMLALYAFVFGTIFPSRWGSAGDDAPFVSMLFCGMIIHGIFADCITRAPSVIVSQPSYVKKVVFPVEILPIVPLCSAAITAAMALVVLLGLVVVQQGGIPATAPLFVPIAAAYVLFVVGLAWIFASLGVYFRDIGQVTGVLSMVLLFASPVFYSVEAVPARFRYLFAINPLTLVIEESRKVLLLGRMPDWPALLGYALFAAAVAVFGLYWFQRTRRGFADVL